MSHAVRCKIAFHEIIWAEDEHHFVEEQAQLESFPVLKQCSETDKCSKPEGLSSSLMSSSLDNLTMIDSFCDKSTGTKKRGIVGCPFHVTRL